MSQKSNRFKETEIGELPEEWEVKPLSQVLLEHQAGDWGKDMKEYNPQVHIPMKIIRSTEFTKDCRLLPETAVERAIPKKKAQKIHLQEGDILVERSGGGPKQPVGRAVLVKHLPQGAWGFGNFIQRLRVKPEFSSEFVWAVLYWHWMKGSVLSIQEQTTGIRNLRWNDYLNLPIPLPPLEEQKRIAGVLRLVDEIAEKTKRIISFYEKVKKHALNRLLTKGIGHSKFKQTEIGELPEEWEVKRLKDLAKLELEQKPASAFPDDTPYVGMEHIEPATGCLSVQDLPSVRSIRGNVFIFKRRHILYGKLRPYLNKVLLASFEGFCSTELLPIRCNTDYIIPEFLFFYLLSPRFVTYAINFSEGTRMPRLNLKALLNAHVPLPPLEEQKRIAELLSALDRAIDNERRYLQDLEKLKRWMLDNLLTGKVRLPQEIDKLLKEVFHNAF